MTTLQMDYWMRTNLEYQEALTDDLAAELAKECASDVASVRSCGIGFSECGRFTLPLRDSSGAVCGVVMFDGRGGSLEVIGDGIGIPSQMPSCEDTLCLFVVERPEDQILLHSWNQTCVCVPQVANKALASLQSALRPRFTIFIMARFCNQVSLRRAMGGIAGQISVVQPPPGYSSLAELATELPKERAQMAIAELIGRSPRYGKLRLQRDGFGRPAGSLETTPR